MRRFLIASVLLLSVALPAAADDAKPASAPAPARPAAGAPATEKDKTLYALGLLISRNLSNFSLTPEELKVVETGLTDGVLGRAPKVELETYGPKLQDLARARATAGVAAEKKAGALCVEREAAQPGTVKEPAGFLYRETKAGTGAVPKATDSVKVHYKGTLPDGSIFDSSIDRGQPVTFALNQVIPCWTQGLQLMKVGGSAHLVCPSDLAYGDNGRPPAIKGGATLVFDVQLLDIEKPAPDAKK